MKLSENFSRHEFACQCGCGFDTVDTRLLSILQRIRDVILVSMDVLSGCRCRLHNESVGGATNSQHLYARAADVSADGVDPQVIADMAEQLGATGVGIYDSWVHIDTRSGSKTYWDKRSK